MARATRTTVNFDLFEVWLWLGPTLAQRTCAVLTRKHLQNMVAGLQGTPDEVSQRITASLQAKLMLEKHLSVDEARRWFTSAHDVVGYPAPVRPCDLVRRGHFNKVTKLVAVIVSEHCFVAA
jgi:hypothetical protein